MATIQLARGGQRELLILRSRTQRVRCDVPQLRAGGGTGERDRGPGRPSSGVWHPRIRRGAHRDTGGKRAGILVRRQTLV